MRDIKVTIIGDSGVGKSSLVTSLVKDSFSPRVQAVVPEILLPLDVTDAGVTTRIVDTSSCSAGGGGSGSGGISGSSSSSSSGLAERRAHLEASLRSADVVLLVYDVARPTTFDRIPTYWLPYLRSLIGSTTNGKHVPVILVGNKIDARVEAGSSSGSGGGAGTTNENLEEELAPVMAEFGEVESCIETSVKEGVNVSEVFYFAQKAVLYPTAPLYDGKTHTLRPACIEALKRIFLLCDADKDHLLSDEELNEFQRRCFGSPLSVQELEAIKDLVASAPYYGGGREEPRVRRSSSTAAGGSSSSNGGHPLEGSSSSHYLSRSYHPNLQDGKLTLHGWLHLHTLFIQKGRLETTWSVLSSYGYGPNLTLTPEYLNPPSFHVPSDCAVELSPYGYSFLTDIFEAHDADRDGALCDAELTALFATAPGGKHPWEGTGFPTRTTTTDDRGAVTLQGWLAQWSMTTLLDYKITLAYLAYLGYPGGAKRGMAALPQQQQPQTRKDGKPGPPPTGTALKLTRRNTRSLFSSAWSSYTASSSASYQSPPKASSSSREGVEDSASKSSKKKKRGDPTERSVFLAYVLGAPGAGKSSLLNAALGKRFENEDEDAATMHGPRSVVTAVEPHLYYSVTSSGERGPPLVFGSTGGYERYLVLQEFPTAAQGKGINSNNNGASTSSPPSLLTSPHIPTSESSAASSSLTSADILLLLYDSSDSQSFSCLSNLRQRYASTLGSCPTLFVASKADKEIAKQRHEVQPEVYVRRLGLERWSPCRVSVGGAGREGEGQEGMVGAGGMMDDVDALGSTSLDTTTTATATATPSSAAAAAATTSITQLLAVACAIAQDPRGNAAVPGLRAAHDRAGGSASWGSWLAGLVGLSSSSAASKDEGGGIDEDGEAGEEESDYDSEGEASSPGQADDSSSPAASSLSSSVASSAGPAARRRRHGDTSTDQDGSKSRRSGKRGTRSSDSAAAATKTMRRHRRTRLRSSSTGPSRRRALLVAFGVVLVGGGAVAAAAVALGVFDSQQKSRPSVAAGGQSGAMDWGKAPRRWVANVGAWANAKGRALGAAA